MSLGKSPGPLGSGHDAGLDYHRRLLDDGQRVSAYERALRQVVRPGDVVLDVGAGTGILSLLAARLGAARVHAVESMPIARAARALVAANGLDGRVIVHRADLRTLAPIEAVDVVVGDFLGAFLADDLMLEAAAAAVGWLKPGGRVIPAAVELFLAPVGDFGLPAVDFATAPVLGVEVAPLLLSALAQSYRVALEPRALLAEPARYLRYDPLGAPPVFDATLDWVLAADGRLRGLAGWFRAELAPGVVLSTEPGSDTHWAQLFFPHASVDARAGDAIRARLRLVLPGENRWAWSGSLARDGQERFAFAHENVELGALDDELLPAPPLVYDREAAMAANDRGAAAYLAHDFPAALAALAEAVRLLDPRDPQAPDVYENLGLAAFDAGRPAAAVRAFLRALDGGSAREQSLRYLAASTSPISGSRSG